MLNARLPHLPGKRYIQLVAGLTTILLSLVVSACASSTLPTTSATTESATVEPTTPASNTPSTDDSSESLFPLTITDAIGQEFTFDAPPKIGCLFFGCYETLSDLGVTPQAATGGSPEDRGANYYTPGPEPLHLISDYRNPEDWAAAEVDLIVVSTPADPVNNDVLLQAAPLFHIYYTAGGEDIPAGLEGYIKNLELLGQVTGETEAAAIALTRYEQALTKLRSLATPETEQLQVALLRSRDTYQLFGNETAFCTVIQEVGLGQCLGEGDFITELNPEQLLALNPDWIIYVTNNDSYQDRDDPVWLELSAVKEGRVYDTVSNRYGCCSVRALYQPLIEYVHQILPDAGAPEILSTADFEPENNWLVNP